MLKYWCSSIPFLNSLWLLEIHFHRIFIFHVIFIWSLLWLTSHFDFLLSNSIDAQRLKLNDSDQLHPFCFRWQQVSKTSYNLSNSISFIDRSFSGHISSLSVARDLLSGKYLISLECLRDIWLVYNWSTFIITCSIGEQILIQRCAARSHGRDKICTWQLLFIWTCTC